MSATGEAVSKDELVVEIARGLAKQPDLPDDWASLAMVFSFDGNLPSSFGYAYLPDDDWEAISSETDDLDDDVVSLRETLKAESGAAFRQALFRVTRDTGEIKFEFAYDEKRWAITPGNLTEMIATLKP